MKRMWQILTDSASFAAWNLFNRRIEGKLRPAAMLAVFIQPPGSK